MAWHRFRAGVPPAPLLERQFLTPEALSQQEAAHARRDADAWRWPVCPEAKAALTASPAADSVAVTVTVPATAATAAPAAASQVEAVSPPPTAPVAPLPPHAPDTPGAVAPKKSEPPVVRLTNSLVFALD